MRTIEQTKKYLEKRIVESEKLETNRHMNQSGVLTMELCYKEILAFINEE